MPVRMVESEQLALGEAARSGESAGSLAEAICVGFAGIGSVERSYSSKGEERSGSSGVKTGEPAITSDRTNRVSGIDVSNPVTVAYSLDASADRMSDAQPPSPTTKPWCPACRPCLSHDNGLWPSIFSGTLQQTEG